MTTKTQSPTPLILDVDGTFLKTDMLMESFWRALGSHPLRCLSVCTRHFSNRAALKHHLAAIAPLRTDLLPVNPQVLELAKSSMEMGREVILASGSDTVLVNQLAEDHGLPRTPFASDGQTNMTGARKADALIAAYGIGGFDYAGNAAVDVPVWKAAENAIIVGEYPRIADDLSREGGNVTEIMGGWRWRDLMKGIRPHQWVKNILLFLPLLAAHQFELASFWVVLLAAMAYSAAASSIYVVNDLLDLEADRLHEKKRHRPFASGAVPIGVGMAASLLLGIFALGVAILISWPMLGIVALYMILSLAYSLKLKRMRWVDIATLAGLYTLRVVAGAVAAQVVASGYLIAFIFPTFVALGCVKRLTELTLAKSDERLPGRGYGRPDRSDLLNVAGLGTFWALLAFFLYSFTPAAGELYGSKWNLWLAIPPIAAWLIRMVVLGWTGKQDYDPIVFALRDKIGIALLVLALTIMFTAANFG
jgi:4-hydroxybenzoate polyprenyltransferase/phosphoserine phosphatase